MKTKICFFMLAISLLAGCGASYKPASILGGYSDLRINANTFRISFRGNQYTSVERAEELALLRSSEVALQNGFNFFKVAKSVIKRNESHVINTPTIIDESLHSSTNRVRSRSVIHHGEDVVFVEPKINKVIICYKKKPRGGAFYDAKLIYRQLTAKYGIKPTLFLVK